MKFYEMLAEKYDEIFPLNEVVVKWVQENVPEGGAVLDVGCATGRLVERLHKLGYDAYGVEYEPSLIDYDKQVSIGDMHNLGFGSIFDFIVCTGNTLAHTVSYETLVMAMKSFSSALKSGGMALVQILNYDYILNAKLGALPDITTDSLTFNRFYHYEGKKIRFEGVITCGDYKVSSAVKLYPIKSDELKSAAEEAGFSSIELFGDFQKNPLMKDKGLPLIALLKI